VQQGVTTDSFGKHENKRLLGSTGHPAFGDPGIIIGSFYVSDDLTRKSQPS